MLNKTNMVTSLKIVFKVTVSVKDLKLGKKDIIMTCSIMNTCNIALLVAMAMLHIPPNDTSRVKTCALPVPSQRK